MKKILYILLPLLFSLPFVADGQFFAARNGSSSLRADAPTTGFCWGDRNVAMDKIAFVGTKQASYFTAFIQTPDLKTEHTLKSISFPWGGDTDANGQILVLDNTKRVIFAQDASIQNGWNTFALSTPLKLAAGKYYLGFAGHSSAAKTYVVGYDGMQDLSFNTASFLTVETRTRKFEVGESIYKLEDVSSRKFGSLMTVADIEGPDVRSLGIVTGVSGKLSGKPGEKLDLNMTVRNIGTSAINSGVVEFSSNGQTQTYDLNSSIAVGKNENLSVQYQLPEKGYSLSVTSALKTINGEANPLASMTFDFTVKVLGEGGAEPSKHILIEEFTTERCSQCPSAKPRVEEAIRSLEAEGYEVAFAAHHAGYYTDFLTLRESERLVPYMFSNGSFAPALAINRCPLGERGEIAYFPDMPSKIVADIKAKASRAMDLAEISEMAFTDKGMTISGKFYNEKNYNDAYLHVYVCENGIKPQRQAGAGYSYIHDGVILKFVYPITGQKIDVKSDGTFKVIVPDENNGLKAKAHDTSYKNIYAVAFISGPLSSYSNRFVYTSKQAKYSRGGVANKDVVNNKPVVKVVNNCVTVEGDCDSFHVFNMAGNIVATSSDTPLMSGMYIVRVSNVKGDFTYKVVVE